jgi:hypothetical protein
MPWQDNLAWDDALAQSPDIVIAGDRTTEFAYRPRQLVCDENVWEGPRNGREEGVRSRLADANATLVSDRPPDERAGRKADIAAELRLRLLDVPDGDIVRLVDDARDQRVELTYHHMVFANPQRHGGCSPPVPLPGPTAITQVADAGAGKRIVVLDTGMPDPPPPLVPHVEPFAAEHVEPAGAGPGMSHGTMVAGVIARHAPGATIVVRRVLETPLGVADELDVVMALRDLPDDVDIVNASFGGRAAPRETMAVFKRAVDEVRPETLLIASAGNEGERRPHFMAAFKRVVAVACVMQGDGGQWELEDYSNRGWWIDLSTVGTDVETVDRDNNAVLCSGTSFAAPRIAAKIAVEASAQGVSVHDVARELASGLPVLPDGGTVV